MDSLILVAGSSIAEDLYKKFFNNNASSQTMLFVSRTGSVAIAAAALLLAWHSNSTVYELVNYAWSGLGSTFGPLMIASLLTDKITPAGAIAGILAGGSMAAVWPLLSNLLPLVPGFSCGLVVVGLVSWLTQPKTG
jgi:sodium/proline symporter